MTVGLLALVLLLGVGALVALAVVAVVALSRKGRLDHSRQNELVPGQEPVVPASWAGSHDPEARLHRRLVEALAGLRTAGAVAGGALDAGSLDLRVQVEARAADLDRRLVAASVLPAPARDQAVAALGGEVAVVTEVAGALGRRLALGGASPDAPALPVLGERLRALDGPPAADPGAVGPDA